MTRAKKGFKARRRRNKILELASGYRGSRSTRYSTALQVVRRGLVYAYRDRKVKKRDFRSLWIVRINAACRELGVKYSEFMNGLKKQNIAIDRSVLANLAATDTQAFSALVAQAKSAIGTTTK